VYDSLWQSAPSYSEHLVAKIRIEIHSILKMVGDWVCVRARLCVCVDIPYILESNPHSVFGDFLNGKKLVCDSNPHLSFNRPLPTGRLIE